MDLKGHIATSLFAVWRFFFEGERVLKYLDATAKGVFRSFFALLFAAPVFFLIAWLQLRGPGFDSLSLFYILGLFAGYGLSWAGYALLIFHAQGVVGPRQNYLYFLPLYNWSRIFCLIFMVPYFALASFGVIGGDIKIGVLGLSVAAILAYKLAIARAALGVNYFHGLVFVLFDVLLTMLVGATVFEIFKIFQ